ncbi:MAG: ROK family protein [Alphaproteobacteria bacterium]
MGGTKIEAIAMDRGGHALERRRIPTPRGDYEGTVRAVATLVGEIETALGSRAHVGVGMPGTISAATGLVKNANSVCLIGKPLDADLAKAMGRPVRLANDADCFALSEATDGAAAGSGVVFGAILGTGVGGGIVVDGSLLTGRNGIAGEWGHNPLPGMSPEEWPGQRCYCGRQGCVETFLSGPGLAVDYRTAGGHALDAAEIAARAEAGEPLALAAIERYEDRLARALGSIINVLDPGAIVLGGGLSNVKRLYANVPERWGAYIFSDRVETALLPPRHGDSSGVRGAAWLWRADEL